MSSTSRPPNASTSAAPPDPALITSTINRLRAEHDAATTSASQAILLHEIGVLSEALGDEAAAAREQLGAVNVEPDFREPLERLIAIISQRQSYKNLGKLLERLVRVADAPEERARALLAQAAFQADQEQDLEAARATLEEAVAERPEDAAGWLALEVIAGRLGDDAIRLRALAARTGLTQHPTWRALLLVDLASGQLAAGDAEAALESLDLAIEQKSGATYLALAALEELGQREDRNDVTARALEAQAALVLRSLDDASTADALGIPRYKRTLASAADALLRAAEAQRRQGNLDAATRLLDQALERLPDDPSLLQARMSAADAAGDTAAAARIAKAAIERGTKGARAAAMWLRVAEGAAAEGNGLDALEAADKALAEDPGCIPARALELDLLAGGHDPSRLTSALEACAEQLPNDEAKARYYLLAADAWARLSGDVQGARAALSQAGMYGASPGVVARVARMLAGLAGDAAWYEEATRRLLAAGATDAEHASLGFELARARLLRGDRQAAESALSALAKAPRGAWLGHALRAYSLELAPPPQSAAEVPAASMPPPAEELTPPLLALARAETDPDAARALRTVVALRALTAGSHDEAITELEELHEGDNSDTVVATALAGVVGAGGDTRRSAEIVSACAAATQDPLLSAAMQMEAGIRYWQTGDRSAAVECFSGAEAAAPASGSALLGWALRAADPDNVESRRRVLESAGDGSGLIELERFALELGKQGDAIQARSSLDAIGPSAAADLSTAAVLARALWLDTQERETRLEALEKLGASSDAARSVCRRAAFQLELEAVRESGQMAPTALAQSARRWAEDDPSPAAALEWLGASVAADDPGSEVDARRALAERLQGEASADMLASATLVAHLSTGRDEALLESEEPAAMLANLELALPGCDPRRRSRALFAVDDTLGDESISLSMALAGWNQLAALDIDGAVDSFRAVIETYPQELIGWEGLRAASAAGGDRATVAEACAALGDIASDDQRGAELWEQAALILIDELDDEERGEFALARAVERDIGRFVSFDRLFRIVRARKDGPRLLELIAARLEVAEDPDEIAKMFWERARVLRAAGDREGALAALENVTMLEPDHVGALALSGEICITTKQFPEAAAKLARLSTLSDAPVKQRLMSGVAAVDLYEKKLGELDKALEVLVSLHHQGLSTLPVRERLARASARAEAWDQATEVLEQLMNERDTKQGRIEAARLAMSIHRDRRQKPEDAVRAAVKLLSEAPGDGEALDLVLADVLPDETALPLVERGRDALVEKSTREPLDAETVDRLARIAGKLENAPLRQAALGVLVALGEGTRQIDGELAVLDQRVARLPQIAIDESALPELCDPDDSGPIPRLVRELAPTIAEALGPGLATFGVGKRERVDPRSGLPIRNDVAAWAGALGLGDFDLYIGGSEPNAVYGVATERPALVLGTGVAAPLAPYHRQLVARELFALRRGTTILRHRPPTDVAALIVAACRLAGVEVPSPHYAMLGEFERQLGKEMSRRVRRMLPELAQPVAEAGQDLLAWVQAATSSLDRLAAVAAGDVSHVLADGPGSRGQIGASVDAQERAQRLLGFVLSPSYLAVRERLGMGVR
jgi:tetratricopeptide (TPR) repeat protein